MNSDRTSALAQVMVSAAALLLERMGRLSGWRRMLQVMRWGKKVGTVVVVEVVKLISNGALAAMMSEFWAIT